MSFFNFVKRFSLFSVLFFSVLNTFSKTEVVSSKSQLAVDNVDNTEKVLKKDIKKCALIFASGDTEFKFGIKFKPETFFGNNTYLLNNCNNTGQSQLDSIFYVRHTFDFNAEYHYGKASTGHDAILFKMVWRNKAVWGDADSIATTNDAEIKIMEAVVGNHRHGIPRLFPWLREIWLQICLTDIANRQSDCLQYFVLGAFPFQLGRGIALGDAYAVDPDTLGFFSPNAVDQYAFAGKLYGDLVKDRLSYDLYIAILDNKWGSFENVNLKTRGQEQGRRFDQARGAGIVNYIVAARLFGYPIKTDTNLFSLEPYFLYNHNPENRIEFVGDATSNLITVGCASEVSIANGLFEFGFDTAYNFGNQTVFGWDRNVVRFANNGGVANLVNSQITDTTTGKPALASSTNQAIINSEDYSGQCYNGQFIVYSLPDQGQQTSTLKNSINRFTDRYVNEFDGSMFVFDAAYWAIKDRFKCAWTLGYASGDVNPNRDSVVPGDSNYNDTYDGFISLQELYSGLRVKSAFLLAGSGKIPRVLVFPATTNEIFDPFPSKTSRFTNLIYTGFGFEIKSCPDACRTWNFKPNLLVFWQDVQTRVIDTNPFFSIPTGGFASPFLGTEVNLFSDFELLKDLRLFSVVAVFCPGQHFTDIKGRPLSREQLIYLNSLNNTGVRALNPENRVPVLGDNTAFFINVGLDYKF